MNNVQLTTFINDWIYTNDNNEITAETLNPVLQAIREFTYDITGDKDNLTTTDNSNLVAAINEIKALLIFYPNAILLYSGIDNPNSIPPLSYRNADFYIQLDVDNNPVQLFQFDGFSWIEIGGSVITSFNTTLQWDGNPITVPAGFSGKIWNLTTNTFVTYTTAGTALTPNSSLTETSDILLITSN